MNLALIPARGGSKGVQRKNLRILAGQPLIVHSIRPALDVFGQVFVSTEDDEIATVAAAHGATIIERPAEAGDETPMPLVINHALDLTDADRVFLLQPTSPLRTADDLRQAETMLDSFDSVMAVFETAPPEWTLRANGDGTLHVRDRAGYLARRQDLEAAYLDGVLYAAAARAFREHQSFLTSRTGYFVIPADRAVDIDTEADLRLAEHLMSTTRHAMP